LKQRITPQFCCGVILSSASSDSGLAAEGGRTSRELLLRAAQARCQPGSFISSQQGHDGALKGKAFFRPLLFMVISFRDEFLQTISQRR